MELIKVLRMLDSPPKDAGELAFVMSDHNQELFSHMAIPPLHSNVEESTP